MKKLLQPLAVMAFLLFSQQGLSQHAITGIPRITNYSKFDYKAASQNWMFTEGPNGFLYAANNDGMLEFDGKEWNKYTALNVVNRAILYHKGRFYVSGYNSFGYYAPNENGNLVYHDIAANLRKKFYFGEVWKILELNDCIYFQSNEAIFCFKGSSINIIKAPERFDFMHTANGFVYVNDSKMGLMKVSGKTLIEIDPKRVVSTKQLSGTLPLDTHQMLIATIDQGIFIYDGKNITPWNTEASAELKKNFINTAKMVNGYYCFGTILNGLYILDKFGNVVLHVNQEKGLSNNNVISIGKDTEGNIWLGLNNGIAKLEFNSALSYIGNPFRIESVYTSVVWQNKLYIGTNSGLYAIDWNRFLNPMKTDADFKLIPHTEGQVWNLTPIGNTLFCGHNDGIFTVSENGITPIPGIRGGWLFMPICPDNSRVVVGNYYGLSVIEKAGNGWKFVNKIEGFDLSSRSIERDENGDFWVSHGYKGIYRLRADEQYKRFEKVQFYGVNEGLPSYKDNSIRKLNGKIMAATKNGVYEFNYFSNKFEPNIFYNKLVGTSGWVSYINEDKLNNLWIAKDFMLSVSRRQEDGKYNQVSIPFYPITRRSNITFEHINSLPNQTTLIGLEDGMAIYDANFPKPNGTGFKAKIKTISLGDTRFNFLYRKPKLPELKKKNQPLVITVAAPYENYGDIQYSYYLKGFDDKWSKWTDNNHKEYTNLSEGTYTIQLKARNNAGDESPVVEQEFILLPPWYKSSIAYIIYILIMFFLTAKAKRIYDRNIEKSRLKGEESKKMEFKEREEQLLKDALQAENEIIRVRNEKLQEIMKRKERELTLSTMHVMQKNELISKMKSELRKLQAATTDKSIKERTTDIIKKVSKDVDNRSEWKTFELHLEQVHEEFIKRLKDRYPDLSVRELRLCVYLKMNMSTKEIASLMNISPRGVEISRYRVRKKMGLERADGLAEVLLEI